MEKSRFIYEHCYLFGSVVPHETIELAPGVQAILLKEENNLCPSYYDSGVVCIQAGSLSADFQIGSKIVKVTSIPNHPQRFDLGRFSYSIQGTGFEVVKMKTYLDYEIFRVNNEVVSQKSYDRHRLD